MSESETAMLVSWMAWRGLRVPQGQSITGVRRWSAMLASRVRHQLATMAELPAELPEVY